MFSGQTFTPTRRIGNTAALLPAWPKTTWDWMARTWGVRDDMTNSCNWMCQYGAQITTWEPAALAAFLQTR
ncbi:hypothetical protein Pssp01_04030 [Pseudomonas sp. NBRC 100443]|nr:hypothetical protein Pssp01_04030 [Pseudomonas sp. NBRC 100443]